MIRRDGWREGREGKGERGQGREGMEGDGKGGKAGRMEEGKENLGSRVGRFNLNSEDTLKFNSEMKTAHYFRENRRRKRRLSEEEEERRSWATPQMTHYYPHSTLLLMRTLWFLVKSTALYSEYGAIWDAFLV